MKVFLNYKMACNLEFLLAINTWKSQPYLSSLQEVAEPFCMLPLRVILLHHFLPLLRPVCNEEIRRLPNQALLYFRALAAFRLESVQQDSC
jgi:hypothetical protein